MIIKTVSGTQFSTKLRSKITFEKMGKRWFLKLLERGTDREVVLKVKEITTIGGNMKKG